MPRFGHVTMINVTVQSLRSTNLYINAVRLTSVLSCIPITLEPTNKPSDNWSIEPRRNFRLVYPLEIICGKSFRIRNPFTAAKWLTCLFTTIAAEAFRIRSPLICHKVDGRAFYNNCLMLY